MTTTLDALENLAAGRLQPGDREQLPLVLTAEVVAGALGLPLAGLYGLVRAGNSPIEPLKVGRRLRFRTSELLAFVGAPE